MEIYRENFTSWSDVQAQYGTDEKEPDQVLLAAYSTGNYEGDSLVVFRNGDNYYIVNGSHCSCYGLEGQWAPEEFESKEFFLKYLENLRPYGSVDAVKELINQLTE